MNTKLFLSISVFLVFAALVFATPLEEEIGFHVDKNESYSVTSVAAGAQTYSLVKVGGVETMVFSPQNALVTDNATIDSVSTSYAQILTDSLRQSAALQNVSIDFNTVFSLWQLCEEASRPVREDWFQTYHIAAESGNDPQLKPAFDKLNNGTKLLLVSMPALNTTIESLNATSSTPSLFKAALDAAYNQVQTVKAQVTPYVEGYALLRSYYADDFAIQKKNINRYVCTLAASSFSYLETDLAIRSQVPDPATISSQLKTKTVQRQIKAQHNKKLADLSAKYNAELPKAAEARDKYPLAQSIIDQRLTELTTSYNKLNTTSAANFDAYSADFESALRNMDQTMTVFAAAYADYNASKTQLDALSAALQNAEKRYGKNDEHLNELKKQSLNLTAQFSAKEEELRTALTASPADFQAITSAALNLTQTVTALQAPENTIDFVTIGVIVVVALILVGFLVYLLKFRRRPPKITATHSPQFGSV